MSKKLLDGLWQSEKAKIFGALPKTKKSLTTLLSQPFFELNNGEESIVKELELEFLKTVIPDSLNDQVMLPFIFQKKKSLYIFLGEKLEQWVVETILDLTTTSPYLLELFHPRADYFVYHVKRVQSKIPTLVYITF